MDELKLTVDGLEKERDFYFNKLRNIEVICQEFDGTNHDGINRILEILYATEVQFCTLSYSFVPLPTIEAKMNQTSHFSR